MHICRATTIALLLFGPSALGQDQARTFDSTQVALPPAESGLAPSEGVAHDAVVALLNDRGFACSGVLVHRRAVLTARHCLGAKRVVFGANAREPRVQRTVLHARGVPNGAIDLGLVILDAPAPVEPYPIRYAEEPPSELRIVGFGCTDAECRAESGRRTYFDVELIRDWGCDRDTAARVGCIIGQELVLTGAGPDTCVGDSGGAALVRTAGGWALVAITSRAVFDSVLSCGDGGVYVRLRPHRDWLNVELKKL